jgi:hypothetical protein
MSTHDIASALLIFFAVSVVLTVVDEDQPKPVWNKAYTMKAILALPTLVLYFTLIWRSL